MDIALILSVVGLIITICFGIIPIIVYYNRGYLKFSKRFPFIISPKEGPVTITQAPKKKKRRRLFRILIPVFSFVCLVIAFLIIKLFLFQEVVASQRRPVAVILFKNQTGDNSLDYLGEAIPNLLITNLEQSKYLSVMTWERMYDLLKIIGKENVKTIDEELAFEICQKDGIEAVVVGSFIRTGDMFAIDAKVLDVESKKLLHSYSTKGEGVVSILKTQIDELSKQISRGVGLSERKVKESPQNIMEVTTTSMDAYNYFLQGRDAYERVYCAEAIKFFNKAVAIDSTFATAYMYLAVINSELSNLKARDDAIEKARAYANKTTEKERLFIDGSYYYSIYNFQKSISIIKQLAKKYPKEKRLWLYIGVNYYYLNSFQNAIKYANKALQLDPSFGSPLGIIAYSYAAIGNIDKSIEYFKRYAAACPADANPYDSMGDLYLQTGKLYDAIESYKKALAIKPDFVSSEKLAYIYALKEDYDEAMKWINYSISTNQLQTDKARGCWWKAFYDYWLFGDPRSALKEMKQFSYNMELSGENLKRIKNDLLFSFIYLALDQFEQARQCADNFYYAEFYENPNYQSNYTVLNNLEKSVIDFKQGQIDSVEVRLNAIHSHLSKVSSDLAKDIYAFYYNTSYAQLLFAQDSLDKILMVYQKIKIPQISFWPWHLFYFYNLPIFQDVLARAYIKKGEIDKAITEYERLIAFDPNSKNRFLIQPLYHYRLAKLYEQKGLNQKALEQYNKFLLIDKYADAKMPELIDAKARVASLSQK
jgi:tetratricopeptide (TPR) repeat protein